MRVRAAKAQLRRMGLRGISLSFNEEVLIITAGTSDLERIACRMGAIRDEMKAIGFSDVLLRLK